MSIEPDSDLPEDLAAPARQALEEAGYTSLEDLSHATEADVLGLHGMGPTALARLRRALKETGRSFASSRG